MDTAEGSEDRLRSRLRNVVWMGEEKDRDLFIWDAPNIDRAVNAVTRLIPIDLSGCDRRTHAGATVAELDGQGLAFEDNRNAVKRIYVPSCGFAGCEDHPTYKRSPTMMKRLFDHSIALAANSRATLSVFHQRSHCNDEATGSPCHWVR